MSLYDEIKNPLDSYENLMDIVDIYSNGKIGGKEIESGGYYYSFLINDYYVNNKKIDRQQYLSKFKKYIEKPCLEEVYNYYSNTNLIPDSYHDQIVKKFKTYEEFNRFYSQFSHLEKDLKEINDNSYKKNEILTKIKEQTGYSDNQIKTILICQQLIDEILDIFDGGSMGFHVNPQNLKKSNEPKVNPEMKYYLNVGSDSYEFASIFKRKCTEKGINYYFKVVNPIFREHTRYDKICIYSSLEDADKYLSIIREIKKEHPEFSYEKPPISCGIVDDFIGVGQDKLVYGSFNSDISDIYYSSFEKVFGNMKKEDIIPLLKSDPSNKKLIELRNEIIKQAESIGVDPKTMCTKISDKDKFKKIDINPSKEEMLKNYKIALNQNKMLVEQQRKLKEQQEILKKQVELLQQQINGLMNTKTL